MYILCFTLYVVCVVCMCVRACVRVCMCTCMCVLGHLTLGAVSGTGRVVQFERHHTSFSVWSFLNLCYSQVILCNTIQARLCVCDSVSLITSVMSVTLPLLHSGTTWCPLMRTATGEWEMYIQQYCMCVALCVLYVCSIMCIVCV